MTLLDGTKVSLIDYLYFFILIIFAADASSFVRDYGNVTNLSSYVLLCSAVIVAIKHGFVLSKTFSNTVIIFVIYWLIASVVNSYFSMGFITFWLLNLLIAYITICVYKEKILVYFETIVFHLSIISLIAWILYLIKPNMVYSICKSLQFGESFTDELDVINVIVYTLFDYGSVNYDQWHMFYRNSGFAFEPGAYASFLCFAVSFNIIRKKGIVFIKNIPLIIFLASLFSTESTTGGMTLILILVSFVILNNNTPFKKVLLLIMVPLAVYYIFQIGFVGEKLTNEFTNSRTLNYSSGGDSGTGRFMSFLLLFQEFLNRPLFGLAGDPNTIMFQHGYLFSVHSGWGRLLSQFGIFMTIAFFVVLSRSIKFFGCIYDRLSILIFVALFGFMVSYNQWEKPLFLCFILIGLFLDRETKIELKNIEST